MSKGETYEECAYRELEEEMGITGVTLKSLFDFYHEDAGNRVWGRAYSCIYDGKIVLQEEEVESGDFYRLDVILRNAEHDPYTPDGMYVLRRYLDQR